jgi:DNA mismatch repair protein MutS
LHEKNRARALFATHFHELTQLAKRLTRVVNLTMRVTDWQGDVVFLHEIVPGAADRSYGIQVAKLAGLPSAVIERAKHLLAELEAGDRRTPVEQLVADLPLFAAPPPAAAADGANAEGANAIAAALHALDLDALSPRAALEALYRLKALR